MDLANLIVRARNTISINQILRSQLQWMLALRIVLYTLLLVVIYIFRGSPFDAIVLPPNLLILFVLTVYLTTILSGFYLLIFQGDLRRFGFIQTLLDTCFVSFLVFFSGSSNSTFTTVFFFPIIAGGLILPRRGGLLGAAAATIQYGAILFLENYDLYPAYLDEYLLLTPTHSEVILNNFTIHGLTFFLAAILSALFGMRLQKTESALNDSLKSFDQLAILYKQIFDNISTGIVTIDGTSTITSANNAIEDITDSPPQSIVGKKLAAIFPNFNLSKPNERLTADFVQKDGKIARIGYSYMIIQQSTNELSAQEPSHKVITLRDISELEKLEKQVRQAEKLAAIGMMSAGIAHDFRNPLTAISGSAQILANEFSSEGTKNYANFELTHIILRESSRLIGTISDFLKFSRPEHANCSWFSLRSCLEEVLQMCRADPSWPTNCKIIINFEENIDLWADEKQMFIVFNHLIQNGLVFCPVGQEIITISAHEYNVSEKQDAIKITVADNGSGITENMREQIFEPFFTSRPEGTGLGLAIVKQTVEAHQGSILVGEVKEGGGALFTLVLPLPV